jgi:hypothetical protein
LLIVGLYLSVGQLVFEDRIRVMAFLSGIFALVISVASLVFSRGWVCAQCNKELENMWISFLPEMLPHLQHAVQAAVTNPAALQALGQAPVPPQDAATTALITADVCPQCKQIARIAPATQSYRKAGDPNSIQIKEVASPILVSGPIVSILIQMAQARGTPPSFMQTGT